MKHLIFFLIPLFALSAQAAFADEFYDIDAIYVPQDNTIYFGGIIPTESRLEIKINEQSIPIKKLDQEFLAVYSSDSLYPGDAISYDIFLDGKKTKTVQYEIPVIPEYQTPMKIGLDHQIIQANPIVSFFQLLLNSIISLFGIGLTGVPTGQVMQYNTTIPNESAYTNNVSDFHILFNGTATSCTLLSPPAPQGWTCRIGPRPNIIEVYNQNGQPITSGNPLGGIQVSLNPPNSKALDWWFTKTVTDQAGATTSVRIKAIENFTVTHFDDCTNFCPPMTDAQFQAQISQYVQEACQKIKNALDALNNEIDNLQTGNAAERTSLDTIKANKQNLQNILTKALAKCRAGIGIECDTNNHPHCNADTSAFVYENVPSDLHLCPSFCTNRGQGSTILHEITHYGDSTDDVGTDPVNAHMLEVLIPALDKMYCKKSAAYTAPN